jgi:hypothetical protein
MRIVILPGSSKEVHLRETPKELPINRWADFQKYLIQSAGIGSSMGDVDRHFGTLVRLLSGGFTEEAAQEAINLQYNLKLMLNKVDVDSVAFGCLVDKFDGHAVDDYSENGLIRLCEQMGKAGLTRELVADIISEVKKKSIEV